MRPSADRIDPDHRVTHHVEAQPAAFADALRDHLPENLGSREARRAYRTHWTQADRRVRDVLRETEQTEPLDEPLLARLVTRHLPDAHALVTASSMPVRDVNRFGSVDGPPAPVYANRGASGIDGTVATTAGVVEARSGPATLLIGDLALWHDLNSLALVADRPVVIVVVNNDGGGIFHKLPIRDHPDVFEPYFTTPHGRSFEDAARTFGLAYADPATPSAFIDAYRRATEEGGAALIEVTADRTDTEARRAALDRRIREAVDDPLQA